MTVRHARDIVLTPELELWVDGLVTDGAYENASAVVQEALQTLKERHERNATELDEIQERVRRGAEQAENGEFVDGTLDEVSQRTLRQAKERLRQAS